MTDRTYTNAAPISKAAFANQSHRTIGVIIDEPNAAGMVNCEVSYPEIITGGAGRTVPLIEWKGVALAQTDLALEKIDQVIRELEAHRARLMDARTALTGGNRYEAARHEYAAERRIGEWAAYEREND